MRFICFALPFLFVLSMNQTSCTFSREQPSDGKMLLLEESFDSLDSTLWLAEIAQAPASSVYVQDGKLWLDTHGGVTVWLTKQLAGNIEIEYERTVVLDSGANDRLSDLNQF